MEARDRSIKAQRISHTGNLSNGHVSKGKSGSGTGDVCHIPRFVGCVPPHSHEVRFASVPMFPGKGQALHVPRPTVRSNVRAVGIHAGSETSEAVVIKASSHSIPIPRRLVKPIPVTTTGGKVDRSISRTVPSSRPISKSREIRAGSRTQVIVFLGEKLDLQRGRAFPTRTPSHSDATSSRGNRAARASISQSGVTSRAVVPRQLPPSHQAGYT